MRVVLDATFARRGPSGTAVYLREITIALRELGVEVIEAADERRRPPAGGGPGSLLNLLSDQRWLQVDLPALARRVGADVLHHPLPALAHRCVCPQVVTVHDLAFMDHPALFGRAFRSWARVTHRRAAARAGAVVCVSQSTRIGVLQRWRLPAANVVVAQHGPGQALPPCARPERPGHLLYVGDQEPRKGVDTLLEAHASYRRSDDEGALPLLLAGSIGAAAPPGVSVVRRPDPAKLAELFAGAAALVHPAVAEGFGLTLTEAMAAGTPVLAARSPAAQEVCGDAALYFAPGDVQGLATQMARLTGDRSLRDSMSERGRTRARSFSWERSAREHLGAYTLALR